MTVCYNNVFYIFSEATCLTVTPKQWRENTVAGYLANCFMEPALGKLEMNRTLANINARQVGFNHVSIYFHPDRSPVAEHLVLSALNCAFVALCTFTSEEDKAVSNYVVVG